MKFVIAGTVHQANEWIQKDIKRREILREVISMKDYRIVHDTTSIRGFVDPHGIFVGTWKERVDIFQIVETLFLQTTYVNTPLQNIYNEIKALAKPKPTPKSMIQKINGGSLINVYINGIMQSPDDYTVQNNVLTVTNPDDYDSDLTVHTLTHTGMYHQIILKPRATISLPI